jgi:hypothetical protein
MPLWLPEPVFGEFDGQGRLSDAQIATIDHDTASALEYLRAAFTTLREC